MNHTAGCGYHFLNEKLLKYCTARDSPTYFRGSSRASARRWSTIPAQSGVRRQHRLGRRGRRGRHRLDTGRRLAEQVYCPLGMTDSTFAPLRAAQTVAAGPLPGCRRQPCAAIDLDLSAVPEWDGGGRGSYGTIADYGRFLRAWFHGGELDGARIVDE